MNKEKDYSSFYISMIIILSVILIATSFDRTMEPQNHINSSSHPTEFKHLISVSVDGKSTTAHILAYDMDEKSPYSSYFIVVNNQDCTTFQCSHENMTCFICFEKSDVPVEVDEQ